MTTQTTPTTMKNLSIQNQHRVIPTKLVQTSENQTCLHSCSECSQDSTKLKRSDEGSLASARDDKQPTNSCYTDMLRDTMNEYFPLLGEVTQGVVDDPLSLMSGHADEDGVIVPCALPDAMVQCLPQMMSEPLSLYQDADIRTMLLAAMMPTLGSAMSNVRVRHERKLYAPGMMNVCVGPSASGKGTVGDVASLIDGINEIICAESAQEMADYCKKRNRYERLKKQLDGAAKRDLTQLVDVNDIAGEIDEPQEPQRRMHKLPSKTTAANYHRLLHANGAQISYLHIPELDELNAANRTTFGDFNYMLLAAHNEEPLHTARKTDDEDYRIERTRLALVATGTESSVHAFIPNLEDGLSTRFIYHNLPAKSDVRDEMDEAMAEAFNDVYTHHRTQLTAIWKELRRFDGKTDEELPRLMFSDEQRTLINDYYRQMVSFIALTQPDRDLRAPILRTRLNLYRMLMIISVLRRHEAMGTEEGMFDERLFTVAAEDLRWGLSYIFYLMMQTSAMYNRLRSKEKEEAPKQTRISALGFLHMLPRQFTTAKAISIGKEHGIGESGVTKKLTRLCKEYYIVKVAHGAFVKVTKAERKRWKDNCILSAA